MRHKSSKATRFLAGLVTAVVVLGLIAFRVTSCAPIRAPAPRPVPAPLAVSPPKAISAPTANPGATPDRVGDPCAEGPAAAAAGNRLSLPALVWAPFGRPETGWETYAPLIAREIATPCAADSPGFAAALAAWQARQAFTADGLMSEAVFTRLKGLVQIRRPFVQLSAQHICPEAPAESVLALATPLEGYAGKAIQLRAGALAAYRRLAAAARAEDPRIAEDPRSLTIFSGYRSPAADAARCARDGNCDGVVRATCSPHRTGLAMDLYVGQAPGFGPDSSADPNRLAISRGAAYRWLVSNADRFGFVPYPFEPWHWEWTGEAP